MAKILITGGAGFIGSQLGYNLHKKGHEILLLDSEKQNLIKKYQYCKAFNCPPYPSLNDTPANMVDAFMIIENEINNFKSENKNEK